MITKEMITDQFIIALIISFLGGVFATLTVNLFSKVVNLFSKKKKSSHYLSCWGRFILDFNHKRAFKKGDKEKATRYQIYLYRSQLYLNNEFKQRAAITSLRSIADEVEDKEEIFLILAERLAHKPELLDTIKKLLIIKIKEIGKVI